MASVVVRQGTYDYALLKPALYDIMERLGGERIGRGTVVVIKPNLLAPFPPERAVLTHPLVVKAAVEYVLERGGKPRVSDSNALGSFKKVLIEGGFLEALRGLPVEFREFLDSRGVVVGGPYKKIEIAADALDADIVINLPKLKTHTHMLLTLGVKNLFGCVVGLRKPEWHLRAGVDRLMFARILLDVYQAVSPAFTVIDGVLAMEGQGPGRSGTPRHVGVLIGSRSAVVLDRAVCRMLAVDPGRLLTDRVAREAGMDEKIELDGDLPTVQAFKLPEITPLVFGPRPLRGLLRRHLVQRPQVQEGRCKVCGECWRYCPAKAISNRGRRLIFDYDCCIRCYCCIEVCPEGALASKETLPGRLLRGILRQGGKGAGLQ